jgi:hypothetical protein
MAKLEGTLHLLQPSLEDMGMAADLAVVGRGKVSENNSWLHLPVRVGPRTKASTFILEGSAASGGLRFKDADPDLQLLVLDAHGGTKANKVGQTLSLGAHRSHPEWVQQYRFYPEQGLIGPEPRNDNPLSAGLCIGIDLDADSPNFIMVERTDERRRCVFAGSLMEQVAKHAQAVARAFPAKLPGTDAIILIVKHPPMPWLGAGHKAIVLDGALNTLDGGKASGGPYWGRMQVGSALDAAEFIADGDPESLLLRLKQNTQVTVDYAGGPGKTKPGQDVNFYGNPDHPEWLPRSVFGDDGTIGPRQHGINAEAAQCCLGYQRQENGATWVKMVRRDDPKRLIFGSAADMQPFIAELVAKRESIATAAGKLEADAIAMCNAEGRKAQLKHDGFTKFAGAIPPDVVRAAMAEINRELGMSSTTTDQFKAKTFAKHPAVRSLINQSMAPFICAELLGGTADSYRGQIGAGQLALRFPGDSCKNGTVECSDSRFRGQAQGWHIDGCASNFIPGTTTHYGEIHNFSVLLGCLLSDVPDERSGELCCFPGSHTALAEYFGSDNKKHLKTVKKKGNASLPNGEKTWDLFKRPVFHGTGKAGDLFVANYMTAHFIAPNTSPHIRYAVYFRVQGPKFRAKVNAKGDARYESMLNPWCDWVGLDGVAEEENEGAAHVPVAPQTREELMEAKRMQAHLDTADYVIATRASQTAGTGFHGGDGESKW